MNGEVNFRIVINPKRPANRNGHFPWQCTLCGAAVAHVDQHAAWHARIEGIGYGAPLPDQPLVMHRPKEDTPDE